MTNPTPTAEEVVNQTSPICEHASAQDDDSPCGVCVIAALREAGFYVGRLTDTGWKAHYRAGRWTSFHDKNSVHMDGCTPVFIKETE